MSLKVLKVTYYVKLILICGKLKIRTTFRTGNLLWGGLNSFRLLVGGFSFMIIWYDIDRRVLTFATDFCTRLYLSTAFCVNPWKVCV